MLLSQIYRGATDAFAQDPELRELIRATFDTAEDDSGFGVDQLAGLQEAAPKGQNNIPGGTPWRTELEPAAPAGPVGPSVRDFQQPNSAAKGNRGLQFQSSPVGPDYVAGMAWAPPAGAGAAAPVGGPVSPQVAASQPQRGPRPGVPAGGAPRGAPAPAGGRTDYPDASTGNPVSAFLAGLGSSNAILPAIGGGMQAVEDLERTNKVRNQTVRALINRGLDPDTALAAVSNPELMKQILPRLFGGKMKLGTINEGGGKQSVFYDEYGKIQRIGSASATPSKADTKFSTETAKNNAEHIKKLRGEADSARETLATLSQLETAREGVSYEGMPFADLWSKFAGYALNEGGGENVRSLGTKIQLSFTELTKGAITEAEMANFAGATPGLGMSDAGAPGVIKGMKAGAQRKMEQSKFYQEWAKRMGGNLEGADDAWDRYTNENLVIQADPKNAGQLIINEKNIANWQRYLPQVDQRGATVMPGGASYVPTGAGEGGGGPTPADFGEETEGMFETPDGRWAAPDPDDPSKLIIWEPPS